MSDVSRPGPAAAVSPTPAGTRTFLFSDIEGSTRLLDELGSEAYTKVLERQAALLRAAFLAHGGNEEGTEGDSFFVVFDSAVEAVTAAVEAQRALGAESWPPGVEVNVRMGLHAGEASSSAAGLVGLDVNRAARIAAAAHGGQIVVSDAVRTLVIASRDTSISMRGLGSHRLKDLREPQPLSQVVADGLRMDQALMNLVENAMRHGQGAVVLSAEASDGAVELHVRDEGPGFPIDLLPSAFERFTRGDPARARGGAGLGLPIVAAIAAAHGGTARARNRSEGGADVWISLPRGT